MKINEFRNFKTLLDTDIDTTERMGFAFMQLTSIQMCQIINLYNEKNLVWIAKTVRGLEYKFGKNVVFGYPVEEYKRITGKTLFESEV